jgi:hypothetical protein
MVEKPRVSIKFCHFSLFFIVPCLLKQNSVSESGGTGGSDAGVAGGGAEMEGCGLETEGAEGF